MLILINIRKYFIVSSIFWILLSLVRYLWRVSLCLRRNLGNLSIRCLISIKKYRIGNNLSKFMVNLIYARNNMCLLNLRKMGLFNLMVNRMYFLLKLLKCLLMFLVLSKIHIPIEISYFTIILEQLLVKHNLKNNISHIFG